jgi:hypothetical protein
MFTGRGRLVIEVHLMQDDPIRSLRGLQVDIRKAEGILALTPARGGTPEKGFPQFDDGHLHRYLLHINHE